MFVNILLSHFDTVFIFIRKIGQSFSVLVVTIFYRIRVMLAWEFFFLLFLVISKINKVNKIKQGSRCVIINICL